MQTIVEAFAAWTRIALRPAGADWDTFSRLSANMAQVERAAVLWPVQTLPDVFELIAMTSDGGSEPTETAGALFLRARV